MMKKTYIAGVVALLVVAGAFFIAAGGNNDSSMDSMQAKTSSSASTEAAPANSVIMKGLDFQQKKLTVKKGTTVTWENQDTASHNVVFDDEGLPPVEAGKLIKNGEKLTYTFNQTGTFTYHCQPHPFMKAEIVVTD